jgi:hypothetical protein
MVLARIPVPVDAWAAARVFALGVVASLASGTAGAGELPRGKLTSSTDVAHCAVYGPGYVRVEGAYGCARIGARMRVEMRVQQAPPFLGGFAPADVPQPSSSGAARAHLRLDAPPIEPERSIAR